MIVRLIPRALICLLIELAGLASADAQLLIVTTGEIKSATRQMSLDTSMSVNGAGLVLPGAVNTAASLTLESVAPATLRANFSDGSSTKITGSLGDFPDLLPRHIERNTVGDGLHSARSLPEGPSAISVSTSVPAITALGGSQTVINETTLRLDLLTVFP